ncbi:SusD/RagB family nutrient-binding outer membrane lipoprotein [Chitinophaga sp. Cy-1792]|uniref:SusD/RagB family nutrient-binding outer membrane lipoprotein n=1 Tax=Chitinophaga sp. Cy-1792 TaxID=2608339 RepID=UPI0014236F90|nr:SusD/RagB family nutrient-binding outer membrane lipoprotein [Chitinophaga sp. Cy-1792]NIG55779.1 SusD/RagB family nutrient-binding outer membrane lipoprotein [Chitinophaga sp. Cy-1792]
MNLKKSAIAGLLVAMAVTGCKRNMDDLFNNPETFTSTKIEYLLPTAIDATIRQDYVSSYNNYFRFLAPMMQLTASSVDPVSGNFYRVTSDKGEWSNYYLTKMLNVIAIENNYKYKLTAAQQEEYKIYYHLAKVIGAYATGQATDLFDDIPYKDGFAAQNSLYGQPVNYYPAYDNQQTVYYSILDDLKAAADYLSTAQLQPTLYESHKSLAVQDILYKGNLSRWVKMANSLRLRLAMRISAVDQARAKQELTDLMQNNQPLITDNADNAVLLIGNQSYGGSSNTILRALNENLTYQYAPKFVVDQMQQAGDPRLPIFFGKGDTTAIVGLPASVGSRTFDVTKAAVIDTVTFTRNTNLPTGIVISAADVCFLLAEARQQNLISTSDAKTYYENGIRASISWYYSLYLGSPVAKKPGITAQPDANAINTLLASSSYAFNSANALAQIGLQKYLNTNFMEMNETYAEFRRLDYPQLPADIYEGQQQNASFPVRYFYPTSEAANNSENFSKVGAKNNMTTRVWWDVK